MLQRIIATSIVLFAHCVPLYTMEIRKERLKMLSIQEWKLTNLIESCEKATPELRECAVEIYDSKLDSFPGTSPSFTHEEKKRYFKPAQPLTIDTIKSLEAELTSNSDDSAPTTPLFAKLYKAFDAYQKDEALFTAAPRVKKRNILDLSSETTDRIIFKKIK